MASRIIEKYRYTSKALAEPSWSACSMSKAPIENQRFVNSTASSSFVAPLIGLPQIVETVPTILMPASAAFLMQRSASRQYCESVVPELAK